MVGWGFFWLFFSLQWRVPLLKTFGSIFFKYTITHFPFSGRLIKCFCFLFKTVSVLGALTYRITKTEQVAFPLSVMTGGVQCFICLLFFLKKKISQLSISLSLDYIHTRRIFKLKILPLQINKYLRGIFLNLVNKTGLFSKAFSVLHTATRCIWVLCEPGTLTEDCTKI